MSDLLTNMAARSQGVAPAIRPRVPSLYEPYRQDAGLLGARQISGEIDFESPRENDSKSNGVSGAAIPLHRLDQRTEPPQPPRQNSSAFPAQTQREPLVRPRFPQTELRADSSPVLPSTSAESTRQPADVATSGIVPPATPGDETHRSQADATPAPAAIHDPYRPQSGSAVLATPGRLRTLPSRLEDSSPSRHLSHQPAPIRQPEEVWPARSMRPGQVPIDGVHPETLPELANSVTPAASGTPPATALDSSARRGLPKETQPQPGIVVQPTLAAQPLSPKELPGTAPAANQSSAPSMRVTIGKVEVRAVFPPAPVNRTAPQRVRPTLSLDDFLKRNSGAGR